MLINFTRPACSRARVLSTSSWIEAFVCDSFGKKIITFQDHEHLDEVIIHVTFHINYHFLNIEFITTAILLFLRPLSCPLKFLTINIPLFLQSRAYKLEFFTSLRWQKGQKISCLLGHKCCKNI